MSGRFQKGSRKIFENSEGPGRRADQRPEKVGEKCKRQKKDRHAAKKEEAYDFIRICQDGKRSFRPRDRAFAEEVESALKRVLDAV